MELKCDFDGKLIENFPILTPCGYTICCDHLIADLNAHKDPYYFENLISDSKSIKCFFCENHQITLEECFSIPKNKNILKEILFHIKKEHLAQKIKEYMSIESDPKHYISQNYKEILLQIDLRRELIKREVDNYYKSLIKEIIILQEKAEEFLKKKIEKFKLKDKEQTANELEEDIKKETNAKNKAILFEQKMLCIQDMLNKLSDLDEFMKKTKQNKLKTNGREFDIRSIFGVLETYQKGYIFRDFDDHLLEANIDRHLSRRSRVSRSIEPDSRREKLSKAIHQDDFLKNKNVECLNSIKGHKISSLLILPTGEIISCSREATIKLWDKNTGECIRTIVGHESDVLCLCLLKSGQIASGSSDRTIKVWDINTGDCLNTLKTDSYVWSLEELCTGDIASGSSNGDIKFLSPNDRKYLKTLKGHTNVVRCLKVLKSNELASGSWDKSIKIWNTETGECLRTLNGHNGYVRCIRELNSNLISCSSDGTIRVWDMSTGECIKALEWDIFCLKTFENGDILSGSWGTIQFWNINETECKKTIKCHSDCVTCIGVLPTGELVTCSEDKTLKIWDHKAELN